MPALSKAFSDKVLATIEKREQLERPQALKMLGEVAKAVYPNGYRDPEVVKYLKAFHKRDYTRRCGKESKEVRVVSRLRERPFQLINKTKKTTSVHTATKSNNDDVKDDSINDNDNSGNSNERLVQAGRFLIVSSGMQISL